MNPGIEAPTAPQGQAGFIGALRRLFGRRSAPRPVEPPPEWLLEAARLSDDERRHLLYHWFGLRRWQRDALLRQLECLADDRRTYGWWFEDGTARKDTPR